MAQGMAERHQKIRLWGAVKSLGLTASSWSPSPIREVNNGPGVMDCLVPLAHEVLVECGRRLVALALGLNRLQLPQVIQPGEGVRTLISVDICFWYGFPVAKKQRKKEVVEG